MFRARRLSTWSDAAHTWRAAAAGSAALTPFQSLAWLDAWYATMGLAAGHQALPVEVCRVGDATPVALLPLVGWSRNGLRVITFADGELTDYNAPLVNGPAGLRALREPRFWKAVRAALPPADLLELHKLPPAGSDDVPCLPPVAGAGLSAAQGFLVRAGDDWEAFRSGLKRDVRVDTARCWRQLQQIPGLGFEVVDTIADAVAVVDEMDRQQRRRIEATGGAFMLDTPGPAAFYRELIRRGLPDGHVFITAIRTPDTLVAAAFGLLQGDRYTVIRHSNAGPDWLRYSPSRAVLLETMRMLHARGVRIFDFSIGDYDYKRRLGATAMPLANLIQPLSIFGVPAAARAIAAMALRRRPSLDRRIRGLLGDKSVKRERERRQDTAR